VSEIDPKDFGALEADVRTLTAEVRLLRQEMAAVNAAINQGRGGLWMLMFFAGALGSTLTLAIKKIFGA